MTGAALRERVGENPTVLENEIALLENTFADLLKLSVQSKQPDIFEDRFTEIADKIAEKKKLYDQIKVRKLDEMICRDKIKRAMNYLDGGDFEIVEYDDALVRDLIKSVCVVDENTLEILFVDGCTMVVGMAKKVRRVGRK